MPQNPPWTDPELTQGLPEEAERALRQAGLHWQDEPRAEDALALAARVAPRHLAVLVGHYRYYFYKHRYAKAVHYAESCLALVAAELGISEDFSQVDRTHADFEGVDPLVRFWLFGLQAYGYVLLRLGDAARGTAALEKLAELDQQDQTKTRVLLEVINRRALGDEAD